MPPTTYADHGGDLIDCSYHHPIFYKWINGTDPLYGHAARESSDDRRSCHTPHNYVCFDGMDETQLE